MLTCFLSPPRMPGGSWGDVYATPVRNPHQSRNLLLSLTRFLTACHFNATLCHSISTAFVTAEWHLYLLFCLSGTERKCTSYRYSLQAISNHLPFWGPNCRPTGPTHHKVRDFHPTDRRSIPITGKRFSWTRICSELFEGQTEYYHDGTGGVPDSGVAGMWTWPITSIYWQN